MKNSLLIDEAFSLINRTLTGAIVERQLFGGCKESSFGKGAKAGGPNYLVQFMLPRETALPTESSPFNTDVRFLYEAVIASELLNKKRHPLIGSSDNTHPSPCNHCGNHD